MSEALPTFEDVRAAAARLAGRIVHTPLLRHRLLDEATGATVVVKPEPLQRTGSFKLRGATNAALAAAAILALGDPAVGAALKAFRARQTASVLENPDPATP